MKITNVILSRSAAEAKNLLKRQTDGEILRRFAPQNDIHQNQRGRLLVESEHKILVFRSPPLTGFFLRFANVNLAFFS
jgi:hypothetical protein